MHTRFVRETVREETATISGGRTLHTWDDLLSQFPQTIGVKTGHTDLAGWCQVAAARGRGVTIYATLLGLADALRAQRRSGVAPRSGGSRSSGSSPRWRRAHVYADVQPPLRSGAGRARRREAAARRRSPRPAADRDGHRAGRRLAAGPAGTGARPRRDPSGQARWSERAIWSLRAALTNPASASRLGWYAGRTLHHLAHLL